MRSLFDDFEDFNPVPRAGDRLRDEALARLRAWRPTLVRRLMRAFLAHLLTAGPATSDALRALVPIPPDRDPRVVGSAVRALAELGLIRSIGRRKSRRPLAHSRAVDLWQIHDEPAARRWLETHPDLRSPEVKATPAMI